MLEQNRKITITGEDALDALKEIEFILISLHRMGSFYAENPAALDDYRKETTEFIDNFNITQRLAKVRTKIAQHFDDTLGDDDMDDVERYLSDLKFWQPTRSQKSDCDPEKISITGGTIEQVTCKRGELLMVFTDRQDRSLLITFHNPTTFQGVSAVGAEVSGIHEEKKSIPAQKSAQHGDEIKKNYSFKSSNSHKIIFSVTAKNYSIEQI